MKRQFSAWHNSSTAQSEIFHSESMGFGHRWNGFNDHSIVNAKQHCLSIPGNFERKTCDMAQESYHTFIIEQINGIPTTTQNRKL